MAATRRSALWSRRRKASGAAEALPQPPSGQSPTLVAWRPKGGRRIWAGKDWLCVTSALGNKWVRTDELVGIRWVIDGHISMRDREGRKLIVKPSDLRENPELLRVVAAAVQRSVEPVWCSPSCCASSSASTRPETDSGRAKEWGAMVRRMLPLVVAVLVAGVLAAPARAIGSFGPPVTVTDPPCEFDAYNVDLAQDTAGVAHGFADLWGSACNTTFRIDYFQGAGASWTRETTPYRGFVVAVAWDATGTYLLYVDAAGLGLRITKRLANGAYTGGRLHGRQRITNTAAWDSAPSLARTPAGTFPLTLVWARGGSDFGANPADLRRALGSAGGTWSSSSFATAGELNFWPDVKVVGTTTFVTWNRDGRTVATDNAGGAFTTSHTFGTAASQSNPPRVGISGGNVFVGWTTPPAGGPARAFVAKRVGGSWTGGYASPAAATALQFLQGVAPRGGKATAVILSLGSRLYATSER